MRLLANAIERLPAGEPHSAGFVGHIVRMQEEIGTGGAGFRFIYAAFLQEAAVLAERPALAEFSERLTVIGDGWRMLALKAARMLKGREPFVPAVIADLLSGHHRLIRSLTMQDQVQTLAVSPDGKTLMVGEGEAIEIHAFAFPLVNEDDSYVG